ncbi:MAG: hypothetical protein ACYTKD_16785 [Planctomycetota bacterium]|jgi:hypothetical protein
MRTAVRLLGILFALLALAVSHVGCASWCAGREMNRLPVRKSG